MSRSYNQKKKWFRNIRNSFIKKMLHCYSDDIHPKGSGKYNIQGKIVRARLKQQVKKEVIEDE